MTRTRLPLPEPAIKGDDERPTSFYTAEQMHAYSDAENAALLKKIADLEAQIVELHYYYNP